MEYGSGAYAQCRVVAGIPTPTIEWKRADGRALSRNVAIQQDGSLLEIKNAGQEEFGMYECVARNDEGESVGRITLVGRGSPNTGDQERPDNNPDRQDQAWVIKRNYLHILLNTKVTSKERDNSIRFFNSII